MRRTGQRQAAGMSDFDLVLSGTVVLADRVIERGYVAVRDGKIAAVGEGAAPAARDRHELGEALILPGAIDAQVHSLSQKDQEDFIWSTRSAAAGGVTTIVDMPYDEGNLVCSAEAVQQQGRRMPRRRPASISRSTARSIPEEGASRIAEQAEAGVAAFKFSTFGTDPKRFPRIAPPLLAECLRRRREDRPDRRRPQRGRRVRARRDGRGEGRRHHRLARARAVAARR